MLLKLANTRGFTTNEFIIWCVHTCVIQKLGKEEGKCNATARPSKRYFLR